MCDHSLARMDLVFSTKKDHWVDRIKHEYRPLSQNLSTAIFIIGAVRDGLSQKSSMKKFVHGFPNPHVFAAIELTTGGYGWRNNAHRSPLRTRNVNPRDVDEFFRHLAVPYKWREVDSSVENRSTARFAHCIRPENDPIRRGYITAMQWLKLDIAVDLMLLHEKGRLFDYIVKTRIDVVATPFSFIEKQPRCLANRGNQARCRFPPSWSSEDFCSKHDFILFGRRHMLPIFQNIWRNNLDCPLEDVDQCQNWNTLLQRSISYKKWSDTACGHWIIPVALRHGVYPKICPTRTRLL